MKTFAAVLTTSALFAFGITGCGSYDKVDGEDHADCEACEAEEHAAPGHDHAAEMAEACPCEFIAEIEQAHGKDAYYGQDAVQADFDVDFGGGDFIAGTMWFTPDMGKVRMEVDNGAVVVFDGQTAWGKDGGDGIPPGYRFHALTWPYFMAAPFKLGDPGTHHKLKQDVPLTSKTKQDAVKMTFGAGVGDAPDDWYYVFKNPQDGSLAALAYIVTFGTEAEEAAKKPSIIFYNDPVTVDGATFASSWKFHYWSKETGVDGESKGQAKLSNIAFVDPPEGAFAKPEGAEELPAPGQP